MAFNVRVPVEGLYCTGCPFLQRVDKQPVCRLFGIPGREGILRLQERDDGKGGTVVLRDDFCINLDSEYKLDGHITQ